MNPRFHSYLYWLLGLIGIELLSWLTYQQAGAMTTAFWLLMAVAIGLAWKRPAWLAYATVAELVIGSKGYLFFTEIGDFKLSIRLGVFMVLAIAAGWRLWRSRTLPQVHRSLLLLGVWLVVATVIGLVRQNTYSNIFFDLNAWLYIGVAVFWPTLWHRDGRWKDHVITILLAGATLIGLKSWLMVLLFGQDIPGLQTLYRWIRNTGVGEVTLITRNVYRVFFQSQVYALLVFFMAIGGYVFDRRPRWWLFPAFFGALGLYISLSRSFWLGLAVGLVALIIALGLKKSWLAVRRLLVVLPMAAAVWLAMSWALNFPHVLPTAGGGKAEAVIARLRSEGSGQAFTARQNQIKPLWEAISKHPVIGNGFGTAVSFFSTDPRVKGWRTTTAFELGYLDLWLKLGLVGVGLLGWWMVSILRRLWHSAYRPYFLFGTVALLALHLTTPYLNHPLGLGWLILAELYARD